MAFLIFAARVHDLCRQKSDVQYKLNKISRKLQHLQEYAATIGNGKITISDLLSSPGSMLGRTMQYLGYAHNTALQYVQANAPMMAMMYQQYGMMQNPQQAYQMQNYIFNSLYAQGREKAKEQEEKNLNIEEGKIAAEKEKLQTQLAEITEELKAAKEARDQGIKDMAPKYTANA